MIVINNHHYPDHFQSLLMMHHYHCHHHHCHWPVKMESLSPLHLIKGFSLNDHQNKTGNSEEQKKLILEGGLTLFPCKERWFNYRYSYQMILVLIVMLLLMTMGDDEYMILSLYYFLSIGWNQFQSHFYSFLNFSSSQTVLNDPYCLCPSTGTTMSNSMSANF